MAIKRSYHDGCGAAHALNLVGERWALLVVRELLLGPKRFTDLRAGLPGISPNVLSQRLDELSAVSIVTRHKLPPPASVWVYDLTDWGRQLEVPIMELGRWGARSPYMDREAELGVDSLIMSFRTMFQAAAAEGARYTYNLEFGDDRFRALIDDGTLDIVRGSADNADAVIASEPNIFASVVYDGVPLADAVRAGDMTIVGNDAAAERFTTFFALPVQAPVCS